MALPTPNCNPNPNRNVTWLTLLPFSSNSLLWFMFGENQCSGFFLHNPANKQNKQTDWWPHHLLDGGNTTRGSATANRSHISIRGWPCRNCSQIRFDDHAKFSTVSHSVHAHVGPQNFGECWGATPFGRGVADPLDIYNTPHLCYHAKFRHSRSNLSSIIIQISQNILTPHAQPFRVTQGHWNWHGSIGRIWLPISVA